MKSKRQKSIEKTTSRYWLKKADLAWGKHIHTIYDKCLISNGCCAGPLQAHHLINRAIRATRHCPKNGVLLCSYHHIWSNTLSAHGAPLAFAKWLIENRPERYKWAMEHHDDWKIGKPDYKAAYDRLEAL